MKRSKEEKAEKDQMKEEEDPRKEDPRITVGRWNCLRIERWHPVTCPTAPSSAIHPEHSGLPLHSPSYRILQVNSELIDQCVR